MSNPFNRHTKIFLSFSRSDRSAIIIISVILFVVTVAIVVIRNLEPIPKYSCNQYEDILAKWDNIECEQAKGSGLSLFGFDPNTISIGKLDSLNLPYSIKQNILKYRNAGGKYKTPADVQKIYGMNDSIFNQIEEYIQIEKKKFVKSKPKTTTKPIIKGNFDPNTTTLAELLKFGFSEFQANNLINYRRKGGTYANSTDILKIYGIDSVFYLSIKKYIKIEEQKSNNEEEADETRIIELNDADSITLLDLDGIGPYFAKRIIKYRELLGGYSTKEQLMEVYNFREETYNKIQLQVYADSSKILKLRINFAEYSELLKHPYLNKVQVKELLDTRNSNGAFQNISELHALKSFDAELINKIAPYVTCQ